jgi:PKD repeat protein
MTEPADTPAASESEQALGTKPGVPATAALTYHSGPLLSNVQVEVVHWSPAVNASVRNTLPGFYSDVMNSAYFDWLSEYDKPTLPIGHGTYLGTFVDTAAPAGSSITQAQVEDELARLIGNASVPPPTANRLYMMYLPPGVMLTALGWFSCTPTDGFCGYHHFFTLPSGQTVYYGLISDLGGCGTRCGTFDQVGNTTMNSSHELVEAVTDPKNTGWWGPGGEIADLCQSGDSSTWGDTFDGYAVQYQWSNRYNSCIITPPVAVNAARFVSQSVPSTLLVHATATVSLTFQNTGNTSWSEATQFRLGSQQPQDNTTWGLSRVLLAPGQTVQPPANNTFTFTITAPSARGTYAFQWQMVRDGVAWFGDLSPLIHITVTDALPNAAFTASCAGRQCTFNGSGSSDREAPIAAYSWSFGDGTSAGSGVAPSHSYATNGTYNVTLTVTDSVSQTAQVTHSVVAIDNVPTAAFTASCTVRSCGFNATGSSDVEGPIASYSWSFGDGTPAGSGVAPSHNYTANGTYNVTLTVTDSASQTAQVLHSVVAIDTAPAAAFTASCAIRACTFNASGSSDREGPIAAYSWSFGDGTAAVAGANPSHSYAVNGTYSVTLSVTDSVGQLGQLTRSVVAVDQPPVAGFWVVCIDRTCSADAETSSDDVSIASYSWAWGDGSITSGGSPVSAPSHAYASYGTYTITLTVTDSAGQTGNTSHAVTVSPGPTAAFTASCSGAVCSVNASGSTGPAALIGYHWDWDDESTTDSSTAMATHTYAFGATFRVHLTVTDANGRTAGVTQAVVVTP